MARQRFTNRIGQRGVTIGNIILHIGVILGEGGRGFHISLDVSIFRVFVFLVGTTGIVEKIIFLDKYDVQKKKKTNEQAPRTTS